MVYTLIGITTAASIAFIIVTIFQCTPIAAFWDKTIIAKHPSAHCFDSKAFWFSYALINIFLDSLVLILPIHEVMKLQLPWKERAGLIFVFSLGALYVSCLQANSCLYQCSASLTTSIALLRQA